VIDGGVRIAGEQIAAVGDIDADTDTVTHAGTDTVTDADTDTVTDANTDIVTDADTDTVIDADGRLVLPGLVDIHGDDIEGHLYPRSGARMKTEMALASADRANVAAGITTKFHSTRRPTAHPNLRRR